MFPSLAAIIEVLAFGKRDGGVTYIGRQLPVFRHREDDVAAA